MAAFEIGYSSPLPFDLDDLGYVLALLEIFDCLDDLLPNSGGALDGGCVVGIGILEAVSMVGASVR